MTPRGSRRADRMLAAPFEPLVPASAQAMEVVAAYQRAIAVEVNTYLVSRAAPRTAALIRERRERLDVERFCPHKRGGRFLPRDGRRRPSWVKAAARLSC